VQAALPEIHHQEGEVVEDVGGRDRLVELDRVEQHRPPVDQRDVPKMKIAMAAADGTGGAPREKERPQRRECRAHGRSERRRFVRGKQRRCGQDLGQRLLEVRAERCGRRSAVTAGGPGVGGEHRLDQRWDDRLGERAPLSQPVERLVLIEALEVYRPFHHLARAAEAEPAAGTGDRHRAAIERRRIGAVHRNLGLAGPPALLQGRKVHEGKAHRALDLVDVIAREEDGRAVGVDALDRPRDAMSCGVGEESEHLVLQVCHGRSAPSCPLGAGIHESGMPKAEGSRGWRERARP
jgi:hypothetical protein